MFWKTMAILWTVLLLILAGAAVQFVLTTQPGSSRGEVAPKGPARGTQATAFLAGVPSEGSVLIPALLNLKSEQGAGKSEAAKLPKDLQNKSLKDLQRCLVVRRLTGNKVAIDVSGCKSDQQARELIRAVADSYIRLVCKSEANMSERTIKRLTDERDHLQIRLKAICRQIALLHRGSPEAMVRGQKNPLLIRLENLSREILEAENALSWAESALKVHEEMQKKGVLANSPDVRLAVEADPILQTLRILLVEVKAGLQILPPNRDKKSAIAVLQGEIKARRKEVLESLIKSIRLERQTSRIAAMEQLADLKVRENTARAEANDANRALSMIDSLESEKKQLEEMLSKIEHRLLEVKMDLLEGVPELIGVFP